MGPPKLKKVQKEAEYQLQISRPVNRVENLQQTLENLAPKFRGTAGERNLFKDLQGAFPQDVLVKKTVRVVMPDVVQTIVTERAVTY